MATDEAWAYPRLWCPVCKCGFREVDTLVIHQLEARHWQPILPPTTVVDATGATQLKDALEAAEARRPTQERREPDTLSW
jgi:hypothetical protein